MKNIHQLPKIALISGVLMLMVLFVPTEKASAQLINQTYETQNTQELIAYLYGIIAQLKAQQQVNQGRPVTTTVSTFGNTGFVNTGGQVLGTNTSVNTNNYYSESSYNSYSNDDLQRYYRTYTRDTRITNIDEDDEEAVFRTTIHFQGAPYVDIFFEYGDSPAFGDETNTDRIYSNGRSTYDYSVRVDDLDEKWYYTQAIIEEPSGRKRRSLVASAKFSDSRSTNNRYDDEPDVRTNRADDIEDDEAILEGEVDMNDFRNGLVFFVYGEDEDLVEDIEDEYDEFRDIDEEGDDLQKVRVDSDLDNQEDYRLRVSDLDEDTDYYFQICVEYEDDDDDEVIECGGVEDFETDR